MHRDGSPRLGVALVVVLTVLLVPVVGLAATGGAGETAAATDPVLRFGENVTEQRGDVATIVVENGPADEVTVTAAAVDGDYTATATVRDGNDDGRVRLAFNTYTGDPDSPVALSTVAERDSVESASVPERVPAAGEYRLELAATPDAPTPNDTARLTLEPAGVDGVDVLTAPRAALDRLDSAAALSSARRTGSLAPVDFVARGDAAVVRVRASGLEGTLARSDNVTDGFGTVVEAGGAVEMVETTEGSPSLSLLSDATTAVADAGNDTYYFVLDTTAVSTPGGITVGLEAGQRFEVEVAADGPQYDARTSGSATVGITDRNVTLSLAGGEGVLAPAPGQVVAGETSLAPGSELVLQVQSPATADPETTVTVGSGDRLRQFSGTLDLSGVSDDATVAVRALQDGTALAESVRARVDAPEAGVTLPAEQDATQPSPVLVDSVELSRGGFVVVRRADGEILGSSDYLDAGSHDDVEVRAPLLVDADGEVTIEAVAYRDRDGDGRFDADADAPYRSDGTTVADARTYDYGGSATTAEPTATPTETATGTDETTEAGEPTATPTPTEAGGTAGGDDGGSGGESSGSGLPGFGPLLALLGVLGAILALRHRRD